MISFGSWSLCTENILCLILLCGVVACCLVVAVILLRWLLKFLRIVMAVLGEFFLFCAALFGSWIGAVGRVFEVVEMNRNEAILEEILENGDLLLEDENGDDVWWYAVNGEETEMETEIDRDWLRWWRIGVARQEREEMWKRVWRELDERDREAFGDVLDYYGGLLRYVEVLGNEYRGWDTIVEEFGDIDIYDDDWEEWG